MDSYWWILSFIPIIAYYFYYKKFRVYIWYQNDITSETKNYRGKSLPCYPNGWFKIMNSGELKAGDVKYIDYCGRNIALFRGTDQKAYALDAYCAHMGANLAIGGTVKYDKCIQCPFHGWVYDGSTGNCVMDSKLESRKGEFYVYHDVETCEKKNGSALKNECDGQIKVKKYALREIEGQILIWYHVKEELREKPYYEPLVLGLGTEYKLEFRGESVNFINCHIQDIPENGADLKHFYYVHTYIFPWLKVVTFKWNLKWMAASDPNLLEYMKLQDPYLNSFRRKLFDKIITPENKQYLSVLSLENSLVIFGKEFRFFTLTGFQLGPGLVYLFLKSKLFETCFQQGVTPIDKHMQRVTHRISTSKFFPYFLSATYLWAEVQQLLADAKIWNNKKLTPRLAYDLTSQADKFMYNWRTWYSQFYEGASEFEKNLTKYDW